MVQLGIAGTLILAAIIGCTGAFLGSIKVLIVVCSNLRQMQLLFFPLTADLLQHLILMALVIAAHIWKLSHYNERKQLNSTEVFVMGVWMKELLHPGSMEHLQQRVRKEARCAQAQYSIELGFHIHTVQMLRR